MVIPPHPSSIDQIACTQFGGLSSTPASPSIGVLQARILLKTHQKTLAHNKPNKQRAA
jgi:hypothetical protein